MVCFALLANNISFAFPLITASSWLVTDADGKILDSENIHQVRPIASITKILTSMVVLDADQDLDEYIKPYTRRELIQLTMINSSNQAAQTLCERYPGGTKSCIDAMNRKAESIGLTKTKLVDPTGLSADNVSTAYELIRLVQESSKYPLIVESSQTSELRIRIRKKYLVLPNTNPIIGKRHSFVVSKTGYIRASGGCLVMMLDTDVGRRIVVVLGSRNTRTRIPEAEFIAVKERASDDKLFY